MLPVTRNNYIKDIFMISLLLMSRLTTQHLRTHRINQPPFLPTLCPKICSILSALSGSADGAFASSTSTRSSLSVPSSLSSLQLTVVPVRLVTCLTIKLKPQGLLHVLLCTFCFSYITFPHTHLLLSSLSKEEFSEESEIRFFRALAFSFVFCDARLF